MMLGAERQRDIVERVNAEGVVKVAELSTLYGVTQDCIRKDLRTLETMGLLKRTYGGAIQQRVNPHELGVASRRERNTQGKRRMAECALGLIQPHSTVFLDISTTNIELAKMLIHAECSVTVITNMLDVAAVLTQGDQVRTIVVGGAFNSTRDGFVGGLTDAQIRHFRFDIAFLGTAGLDTARNAVLTYLPEDGITKTAALAVSRQAYLLAETYKFAQDGDYSYSSLDAFTGIVLDGEPPSSERRRLEELGLAIIC